MPELVRVSCWNPLVLTFLDLDGQSKLIQCLEGWSKGRHFISQAPERPDITFFIIVLVIYLLRTHVIRRADISLSKDRSMI